MAGDGGPVNDETAIDEAAIDGPQGGGRRLVLLRHAKSDWPDVADHDRPLAKRGRRDAPAVGRWLGQSGYGPQLRAAAPGADPEVRYESRVYEATVLGLLMLVREFPSQWRTALLIGHNPGMAELTAGLADPSSDPPSAFPTAAVAVLGVPGSWADTAPGEAGLLAFAIPADMRSE
jgi:phosphohistidine phosphatase